MDDSKILEIKVGITVLVAVTLMVLGIVWLKGITFKPNTYEITILFPNTAGLQVGDPVMVSGLRVGKVTDIMLERDSVLVFASLSNAIKLKTDATAVISSADFFGGKKVEVMVGKDSIAFGGKSVIRGQREPDITELTSQMKDIALDVKGTLQKADSVLVGLNGFINDRSVTNALKSAIYNLDSTTARVKSLVVRSDLRIDSLLTRLGLATRGFRVLIEETDLRLDTTFANASVLTKHITSATASLDSILNHVQSGQGSLGKLIYDDRLYERLDVTATELDSLVRVLRDKGVKMNVKLFGD